MAKQIKHIPKRDPLEFAYTDNKDRKMVSFRLPEALIKRMNEISEETGYTVTQLIQYALDQFAQIQDKHSK